MNSNHRPSAIKINSIKQAGTTVHATLTVNGTNVPLTGTLRDGQMMIPDQDAGALEVPSLLTHTATHVWVLNRIFGSQIQTVTFDPETGENSGFTFP